jgi:hypothetical protein
MLLELPHDVSGVVSTFLDTYDANNLRLVSKGYNEEVETLKFAKPVYKENEKGYCKITVNKNFKTTGKYTLYIYDSSGGWPYFFEDKLEVKSIIESYNTFTKGRNDQKQKASEKAAKEAAYKREHPVVFIKQSSKPAPWARTKN